MIRKCNYCSCGQEVTVTYKKDVSLKMSLLDYIIRENVQYLSHEQKLHILDDIERETSGSLTSEKILSRLPHRNGDVEIS